MKWMDLAGTARRLTLMVGTEAMQSGFHFALNLALVPMLSVRDFGVFSIVMVIGGLSLTYIRALAGMPASIWIGRSRTRTAAGAYDVTFGSGAVLLSVFAAAGVYLLLQVWLDRGALAGGGFVGLWSMRSYLRTAYFARGRRKSVILADFAFVASGALLASLLWLGRADVLQSAFLLLAVANAIGIAALLFLGGWPFRISYRYQVRQRYARMWRQLGWAGLSVTLTNLQGQAVALLVTAFGGPAAYAPIAATLLLFVPLRIAATALVNMLQPEISAELARGEARRVWGQVKLWFGITGSVGLIYGAMMLVILPRIHLHVLEGVPILVTGFLAWSIYTTTMLNVTPRVVLEVMSAFGTVALITGTAAVIGASLIVFLLFVAPPVWALAGGATSELLVLMATGTIAYRKLQTVMAASEKAAMNPARG
ncbi:MAG: MATE family efflux transporter [Methylovirgula sp.]